MPTPAKTSLAQLVAIGRELVESGGPGTLTVSAVAAVAGVKPPSLYKHFADRNALATAVEIAILDDLTAILRASLVGDTTLSRLTGMAIAYRQFARENPRRYALLYSRDVTNDEALAAACYRAASPMLEELSSAGIPPDEILARARTITAFLHGFISMEIVNAFRLGGDVDIDFHKSLHTILQDVARAASDNAPSK